MGAPPRWLEVAVPAHAEAVEAVSEILTRVGYRGVAVDLPIEPRGGTDHTVKAYLPDDADAFAKVSDVRDALGHLQAFGLGPIGEVAVTTIEDEDWLEAWKAQFVPLRVGVFVVRPSWSKPSQEAERATSSSPARSESTSSGARGEPPEAEGGGWRARQIEVVLDPGMAFGTGLHPTTQQCLEALSALPLDGRSLVDIGTGSGILAIAAAKRGASPVVAVDTDRIAVDAARENAARNGVAIPVGEGSAADVPGRFDVVVANIVAPVLQRIAGDLAARLAPRGTLVVAGISAPNEADTRAAFAGVGLRCRDRTIRDDWVALALDRA